MNPVVVLRSPGLRAVGAAAVALGVVLMAGLLLALPEIGPLVRWGAPACLLALFGVAVFWHPYVEVSDGGVVLVNPARTVILPWPAVEAVDGRLGLQLTTPWGTYAGWAVTAPSGRQRLRAGESEAAELVRSRLEELHAAGHLDHARLEFTQAPVRWHRRTLALAGFLLVLSVAAPLATALTT